MAPPDPRRPPPYQDRSQRFRVVPEAAPESSPDNVALDVDLRSRSVRKVFRNLPVWGQVMVLSSVGLGASAGAVVGGVAKVLGVQTAASASADKAELKLSIEAGVKAQQVSNDIAARHHDEYMARFEKLDKSAAASAAAIRAIGRQLGQKRAPKAPEQDQAQ